MTIYNQIAIAFLSIAIFARISRWMDSFFPPFYILAGIITGPFLLNIVSDIKVVGLFGEIGVVFLLLYLGFEFSINTLVEKAKSLITAGLIDLIINFGIGFLIGKLVGLNFFYSFVMAGIIYMSSSGIITKTLIQLNAIKDPEGQLVMGIMVFEDLVMVIFLVFVSTFSNLSNNFSPNMLVLDILIAVTFCFGVLVIGKKFNKYITKFLNSDSKEIYFLTFMAIVLGITALGIFLGVSEALGAFFIGMMLSESEIKYKMEDTIITFRDIFGGMFFFHFGMKFNVNNISIPIHIMTLIILAAVLGKIISALIIRKSQGCSIEKGLFIGLITIPRGEFSLLIAGMVALDSFDFESFSIILVLSTALISTIAFMIVKKFDVNRRLYTLKEDLT
ncbi:MAG: cation:proton antiporter [Halanaerobiales bacterium]